MNKFLKRKASIFVSGLLLLLSFCFLPIGSLKRAKAAPDPSNPLIGNILDYSWANWFDESKTDYYLYTKNVEVYGFHSLSNGFEFIVDSDYTGATLIFDFCNNDYVSWSNSPLHSLVDYNVVNREFTWSFTMDYGSDSFYYDDAILIAQNGITQSKEFECMALDVDYIESDYTDTVSVYMRIYNLPIPDSPTTVRIQNITLNRGSVPYTYSPFWDSLTDFPSPLPYPIGETPPEDSSSDSSSETPEPPEDSSSDSSSEIPDLPEDTGDYNQGFEDGYGVGYDEGFDNGFSDGLNFAKYGIFGNCVCYIQLNYNQYEYERISATDDFLIYGGLDLSKFKPLVQNKTNVVSWYIYFNFSQSSTVKPVYTLFNLLGTGSDSIFIENPWFLTVENWQTSKNLDWSVAPSTNQDNPIYKTEPVNFGIGGSSVVLGLRSPFFSGSTFAELNDLTIYMADNMYAAGYEEGNIFGYNNGLMDGLTDNQEAIYNEGHRVGYDDGYAKGFAQNNSFLSLFSAAIDAPVLTFTSMLDFTILGYNMKGIAISLLSIALIVCIIRLFAKGVS